MKNDVEFVQGGDQLFAGFQVPLGAQLDARPIQGDLGLEEERVGLKGSPTFVSEMTVQERKRQVEFITGTREEKVERLTQELVEAGVL